VNLDLQPYIVGEDLTGCRLYTEAGSAVVALSHQRPVHFIGFARVMRHSYERPRHLGLRAWYVFRRSARGAAFGMNGVAGGKGSCTRQLSCGTTSLFEPFAPTDKFEVLVNLHVNEAEARHRQHAPAPCCSTYHAVSPSGDATNSTSPASP
jgi:hypothetical protein